MLLAYTLELKNDSDAIRAYEHYHANPFPQVAQHWQDIGVTWAKIYRHNLRLIMLIHIAHEENIHLAWSGSIAAKMRDWDELMKDFQIELKDSHYAAEKLGKWTRMQEIYNFGDV